MVRRVLHFFHRHRRMGRDRFFAGLAGRTFSPNYSAASQSASWQPPCHSSPAHPGSLPASIQRAYQSETVTAYHASLNPCFAYTQFQHTHCFFEAHCRCSHSDPTFSANPADGRHAPPTCCPSDYHQSRRHSWDHWLRAYANTAPPSSDSQAAEHTSPLDPPPVRHPCHRSQPGDRRQCQRHSSY